MRTRGYESADGKLRATQPLRHSTMSNVELLQWAVECFGVAQRREEYFSLYAEDIVLHGYEGVESGISAVKEFYRAFWKAFPDASIAIEEVIASDDRIAVRYLIIGSLQGPFLGIAARGQAISLPGISVLHFRDGKCFERWACSDSQVLLRQLEA
ncbi:MAG TPA: ester cyclase [Acidobacteriaceae bacterium]|nr:ester cyclase [Acidobacteriaceae bacterium]